MFRTLFSLALISASATSALGADYPQKTLRNKAITVSLVLPDASNGYYRGSRFDWTGLISKVEYQGHTLFQEWKSPHQPEGHDDVGGTAEEFGMTRQPLGYADAKVGGKFLKLGIGLLEKPDDKEYQFYRNYKIVEPAKTEITSKANTISFLQKLQFDGYGYEYKKTITLDEKLPQFTIERTLKNTGKKEIVTDHYGHNFISFDGKPVGPDYLLSMAKKPTPRDKKTDFGIFAMLNGPDLRFKRLLENGTIYTELDGLGDDAKAGHITVLDQKTGFGVSIQQTEPLKELHIWGIKTALCPEPFVDIKLAPSEEKKWSSKYELFVKKR